MRDLTQERVKALFDYDPEIGEVRWRNRPREEFFSNNAWAVWNGKHAGTIAGWRFADGHRYVRINKKGTSLHRVIWMHVYGEWPDVIDHINGIPDDNRLINLRNVSQTINMRNQVLPKNNTTGAMGVRRSQSGRRWHAEIRAGGKKECLGTFDTFEKAVAARKEAEARLGYHPNHGRVAA